MFAILGVAHTQFTNYGTRITSGGGFYSGVATGVFSGVGGSAHSVANVQTHYGTGNHHNGAGR